MSERACPICRKPVVAAYRPFCSRRCADVDLQRWLTGRYTLGEHAADALGEPWADAADPPPEDR